MLSYETLLDMMLDDEMFINEVKEIVSDYAEEVE